MADEGNGPGTRGQIGREIYAEVERLRAEQGMNASQAFNLISERTGRRPGTVAANYYRIQRMQQDASGAPRPPRRGRRTRTAAGDLDAVLSRAQAAIEELAELVRRQDQELARYREQDVQLRGLMRSLGVEQSEAGGDPGAPRRRRRGRPPKEQPAE